MSPSNYQQLQHTVDQIRRSLSSSLVDKVRNVDAITNPMLTSCLHRTVLTRMLYVLALKQTYASWHRPVHCWHMVHPLLSAVHHRETVCFPVLPLPSRSTLDPVHWRFSIPLHWRAVGADVGSCSLCSPSDSENAVNRTSRSRGTPYNAQPHRVRPESDGEQSRHEALTIPVAWLAWPSVLRERPDLITLSRSSVTVGERFSSTMLVGLAHAEPRRWYAPACIASSPTCARRDSGRV